MADLTAPPPVRADLDRLTADIARRAVAADRGERSLAADLAALEEAGLIVAPLPPAAGGDGLGTTSADVVRAVTVLRALGRANLSLARIFEGHVNAVKLVALYGNAQLEARVFGAVRGGARLGVWGADGERPLSIAADGQDIVLSGGKRFASGLGLLDAAVVTARTADGVQLVLVPVSDASRADPAAWHASGMRATASGGYDFDGVRVDRDALVGAPGDVFREPHFEGGVWRYCAAHTGGAEALFDAMLGHLATRSRAADPLQETRIAAAALACETARLWVEAAARRVETGPAGTDAAREGAAAYALLAREATEAACLSVMEATERAMGTAAFMHGEPAERIRRDLALFLRQAAPDAKRARAARALVAAHGRAVDL